jgi:hypothetical protein
VASRTPAPRRGGRGKGSATADTKRNVYAGLPRKPRAETAEQLPLVPSAIPAVVDRDFDLIARVATERKARELAEWDEIERIESAELEASGGRVVGGVYGRWSPPARYEIPPQHTEVDDEAFLEAEREQLGIDRRAGTLRKLEG